MAGWIKVFRKLQDWQWYSDNHMVRVFLHFLLEANHEKRNWKGVEVLPGQLIFGRKAVSETLAISEQSLRTCITRLKSTNEITIKSTNKFSLITIVKWEEYQSDEKKSTSKSTSKLTNEQPTTNQQLTTPKEYEEDKKNINTRFLSFVEFVNQTFGKKYRPIDKAKASFRQRIEVDKYSPAEIKQAILNLKSTQYHIDNNFKYCTPEFILRESTIEKYKGGTAIVETQKQDYSEMNDFYQVLQNPNLKAV